MKSVTGATIFIILTKYRANFTDSQTISHKASGVEEKLNNRKRNFVQQTSRMLLYRKYVSVVRINGKVRKYSETICM